MLWKVRHYLFMAKGIKFAIGYMLKIMRVRYIPLSPKVKRVKLITLADTTKRKNIDVVLTICDLLDEIVPKEQSYREQITYVADRPGHDRRYAIDAEKISRELGWKPQETFESGIRKTVEWYLSNTKWVENVKSGAYQSWIAQNYEGRQ